MNIYQVNKFLSSENKSKLIAHFWDCHCASHDVSNLIAKLKITQPNLSKHITALLKVDILKCTQKGKKRFYKINEEWKKEWKDIVNPQVEYPVNKKFKCDCQNEGCNYEI